MSDFLKKISPMFLVIVGLSPLCAAPPMYVPAPQYAPSPQYAPAPQYTPQYVPSQSPYDYRYSGQSTGYQVPQATCEEYDDCCNPVDVCCYPVSCGNFFVNAEYLYWRASEEGVEFTNCITTSAVVGGILHIATEETDAHADFHWNSGFRIGAGYMFADSCWAISAYWARYHGSAQQSDAPAGDTGDWHLDYNVEDLIFERPFYFIPCTTFVPYLGVRFAQISQKLNTFQNTAGVLISDRMDKQKFWGIGPEVGFEADYMLPWGLSLYGGLGASVLYGHTNVQFDDFTNFITDTINVFGTRKVTNCQFVVDAEIGFAWNQCICDHLIEFAIGLEHQRFFNHNFLDGEGYGDLCLSGLTVSINLAL